MKGPVSAIKSVAPCRTGTGRQLLRRSQMFLKDFMKGYQLQGLQHLQQYISLATPGILSVLDHAPKTSLRNLTSGLRR